MSWKWDGETFVVDSVKLFLNLLSVKRSGLEMPHYLRISEIGEQIYTDSVYYPNRPLALTGFEIADILLPVLKPDTINTIVIPVPLEFGNYILRDTSMLFYNNNYFALYLHDDLNNQKVVFFVFDAINNKNASYNVFSHDYNTADPESQ